MHQTETSDTTRLLSPLERFESVVAVVALALGERHASVSPADSTIRNASCTSPLWADVGQTRLRSSRG